MKILFVPYFLKIQQEQQHLLYVVSMLKLQELLNKLHNRTQLLWDTNFGKKCLTKDIISVPKHAVAMELFRANNTTKFTKRYFNMIKLNNLVCPLPYTLYPNISTWLVSSVFWFKKIIHVLFLVYFNFIFFNVLLLLSI